MKHKRSWILLFVSLFLVLSACQSTQTDNETHPKNTEAAHQTIEHLNDHEKIPEYLPQSFPLPQDARISTSHSTINDGKKSVLLIFSTEESMSTITNLYKDYFKTQNLDDSNYSIDSNNIIIQGNNVKKNESWSMIGGALASKKGVIELTINWSEL